MPQPSPATKGTEDLHSLVLRGNGGPAQPLPVIGGLGREQSASTLPPVSPMPRRGDPYANAFIAEPMMCWRMVHDRQGQATHCMETPSWTGRWFAPSGDRWWRVWACPDHLDGLTGLREFGARQT